MTQLFSIPAFMPVKTPKDYTCMGVVSSYNGPHYGQGYSTTLGEVVVFALKDKEEDEEGMLQHLLRTQQAVAEIEVGHNDWSSNWDELFQVLPEDTLVWSSQKMAWIRLDEAISLVKDDYNSL